MKMPLLGYVLLGLVGISISGAYADEPVQAPHAETRPSTRPVDARVQFELQVIRKGADAYLEIRIVNVSDGSVSVPRCPTGIMINQVGRARSQAERSLEVPGTVTSSTSKVNSIALVYRDAARTSVNLAPDEGFLKRVKLGEPLAAGKYSVRLSYGQEYRAMQPSMLPLTVPALPARP